MMDTQQVFARNLCIDDIVLDEDGEHEVTSIDRHGHYSTMGVTMHGEETFGEFVYRRTDLLTIRKRKREPTE